MHEIMTLMHDRTRELQADARIAGAGRPGSRLVRRRVSRLVRRRATR